MKMNDEISGLLNKAVTLIQNTFGCDQQTAATHGAMAMMEMHRVVGSPEYQPTIDALTEWAEEAE